MFLQRQWQEVTGDLQEYIQKVVVEWRGVAGADYTPALSQPLLHRRHDSTIAVNFSAEVFWSLLFVISLHCNDGHSSYKQYVTNNMHKISSMFTWF